MLKRRDLHKRGIGVLYITREVVQLRFSTGWDAPIEIEITGWAISTEELFPFASTIELAAAGCVETLKLGSRRLPLELGSEATVETCYIKGIGVT